MSSTPATECKPSPRRAKDIFGDCALVEIIHLHDCFRGALTTLEVDVSELCREITAAGAEAVCSTDSEGRISDLERRIAGRFTVIWSVFRAHSAAEDEFISFSKVDGSGGSDGARMRFNPEASWGANAGLAIPRKALEDVKAKHPGISYADLYTLAGVVAVEEAGGPKIPYRLGRTDATSGETSPKVCGLPDADKGSSKNTIQHVRDVFYRMGFNDKEIVALLGAHALGRCHVDRSGYWGPWTFSENSFSNEYFRLLVEERWSPKTTHNGKPWEGPDQFEDSTGKLMMLPSDMVLIQDPAFLKVVELYAKDEDAFFKDYASAFSKLLELGVDVPSTKPWYKFGK